MQVGSNTVNLTIQTNQKIEDKSTFTRTNTQNNQTLNQDSIKKLKSLGAKGITQAYMASFIQQSISITFNNSSSQGAILDILNNANSSISNISKAALAFSNVNFADIGYTGKNPLSMNKDELNALIGENGFFGLQNTANRIADFVIQGAGDDLEKLQKGFEGMKNGFKEAEKLWGGKLPQLSQDTIDKAIEKVSAKIDELGANAININA